MRIVQHKGHGKAIETTVRELEDRWGHDAQEWGWTEHVARDTVLRLYVRNGDMHVARRRGTDADGYLITPQWYVADRWDRTMMDPEPADVFSQLLEDAE